MKKVYLMPNGLTYQYDEGKQPKEAVEVVKAENANETKAGKPPLNKAKAVKTK